MTSMETTPQPVPARQLTALVAIVCVVIVAFEGWRLPSAWNAGIPDAYPGQHKYLFFSAVRGVALGLVIPIRLLGARISAGQRERRAILWSVWVLVMAAVVLTFVLERSA